MDREISSTRCAENLLIGCPELSPALRAMAGAASGGGDGLNTPDMSQV